MIHVCYNVNSGIFNGLLLSIASIAKRTTESVNIHILTMDLTSAEKRFTPITQEQLDTIRTVIQKYNPLSRAEIIDCADLYLKYFSLNRNRKSFYTPYAMLRLFLDLTPLDGNPEKVIYIDADTMCAKDISALWDIDISGYEFGVSLDAAGKFWIDVDYCNSGVMLINLNRIKETGLFEKCRKRVATRTMFMPDQSALNDFAVKKLVLPRKFNEQRKMQPDTVIKHFCRVFKLFPYPHIVYVKQWEIDKVQNVLQIRDFDDVYSDLENMGLL